MKRKNIGFIIGAIVLVILVVLFILDYNDLLNGHKLNMEFWAMIGLNVVTIALFVITFFYIEKRNLEKEDNQKKISYFIIRETYKKMRIALYMVAPDTLSDSGREYDSEKYKMVLADLMSIKNTALEHDCSILEYSEKNGIINISVYEEYINIKELFIQYFDSFQKLQSPLPLRQANQLRDSLLLRIEEAEKRLEIVIK